MLERGLVQVYTGDYGHFNFAPIGLCFRAAGQGLKSLITCFAPHELMKGASEAAALLEANLVIDHLTLPRDSRKPLTNNDEELRLKFQETEKAALSGDYDIVVLNDILALWDRGIIPLADILKVLEQKPPQVEVVLTGPLLPEELLARADLVTHMVIHEQTNQAEQERNIRKQGRIEVITGNGKGKTTYCLGKALLTSALGVRSIVLQFIKSPRLYGEVISAKKIPFLEIRSMGKGFLGSQSTAIEKKHQEAATKAWEKCLREIFSLQYGLVVLDEINTATFYGLVNTGSVSGMCSLKPQSLELLLSGRNAHAEVLAAASKIIEMKEIKHPFRDGIRAREGIEY